MVSPAVSPPHLAPAIAQIDLHAIASNYRHLSALVGPADCAAVVKADSYGLGAAALAPHLEAAGCRTFFVAHLDEAVALRPVLSAATRLFVLNGLAPGAEGVAISAGIVPVLNSLCQCRRWSDAGGGAAALQVDTGMSRLGLSEDEQIALVEDRTLRNGLDLVLLMSHLANADRPDHPSNRAQLAAFEAARSRFPGLPASLANSGGIFLGREYHFDLCRPGAALYGITASPLQRGIRPVVSLKARVVQTRSIEAGTGVGYGYRYRTEAPMRIATIAVGYADGWLRSLSGRGRAYASGRYLPILGTVSMDSLVIDITALKPDALAEGDLVELIGPHLGVDEIAGHAGTIGYEILTSLGRRYARIYEAATEAPV